MEYRLTQKNIADLAELQKIVSESTYEDFKELAEKEYDGREGDDNLIDFDYKCLTGTIDKENNCLCGTFDIWDDEGQWVETIRVEEVKFKEVENE